MGLSLDLNGRGRVEQLPIERKLLATPERISNGSSTVLTLNTLTNHRKEIAFKHLLTINGGTIARLVGFQVPCNIYFQPGNVVFGYNVEQRFGTINCCCNKLQYPIIGNRHDIAVLIVVRPHQFRRLNLYWIETDLLQCFVGLWSGPLLRTTIFSSSTLTIPTLNTLSVVGAIYTRPKTVAN